MIIRGITFPNEIIKSIEEKKLVVFVGAGVSIGKPTCLPNFYDLANEIAKGSGIKMGEDEPCDVFLGRLKFRNIDVNGIAAEKLSGMNLKPNKLHEYIIQLFDSEESIKIITTNYDQMLEQASETVNKKAKVYNSPALPLGNDVSGIVHIHGNIKEPKYMVLTDSDFGRAYMVDGYVSRFLIEIFKNYTVLFIGYSYNDVIMRYLTRAMVKDEDCKRFILTDDTISEWHQLGIKPVIFPLQDYESLYDGIKYLGEITNRKPSEWKELLDKVSNTPPLDYALESEVEYCLEDKNKRSLFTEIVHGEEWLWWLDKRHIFDKIFSQSVCINKDDMMWMEWLVKEFACGLNKVIQKMIVKHNGYNDELAKKIIIHIAYSSGNVSDEQIKCLVGLFKEKIDDDVILFNIIELLADRKMFLLAWDLYKKYYDYKVTITNLQISSTDAAVEYHLDFMGNNYQVKEGWEKIKDGFLDLYPQEMMEFGRSKILEIHDRYCALGLANDENEPWEMMRLPIERKNRWPYSDSILLQLIDSIWDAVNEMKQVKSNYLQEFMFECLKSRSVLLKKIGLKILRGIRSVTSNQKIEILINEFDLYSANYQEQIFLLIKEVFDSISEERRNKILDIIETGSNTGDVEVDAYKKFNWCSWLKMCKKDHDRIEKIINDVKKEYPHFEPRENPELNIKFSHVEYDDRSPYSEKELLAMNVDQLITVLKDYNNTDFDGPNRDGLLLIFSKCIKENYDWTLKIIPKLKESFKVQADIWTRVYESVTYSDMLPKQKYEILKILSEEDHINIYFQQISRLIEKIVKTSEKKEIKDYEEKIWNISNYILDMRLVDNPNHNGSIITSCFNSASSLCVVGLIRLYRVCDDEEGKRYLSLFEKIIDDDRSDEKEIICALAGQFNYFFNRNKKWCLKIIFPLFLSIKRERFAAAWEGYTLYSGRLYYGENKNIQKMYLDAVDRLGEMSKEARCQFIGLYAVLVARIINDPIDDYIAKLMIRTNEDERCIFTHTINCILEEMPAEEVDSLWNNWLNRYVYNRVHNMPISFGKKELIKVVEWVFHLGIHKKQFLTILSSVKIPAIDCSMILFRIKEQEWYKDNCEETKTIIVWILAADGIPSYIFNEINKITNMLEKQGVDCDLIHEKMISKGKAM